MVFEYLITKGTPVARDILTETFWPSYDPKSAANNLRMAVHGLRRTLNNLINVGSDFCSVPFSRDGYFINYELEVMMDVEQFERHCDQGRKLEREKKIDAAMKEFEQAESLYQGDFLEDQLYEDWALARRETLKDTYLLVIGKLADYYLNMIDYEKCILCCQKMLDRDVCREDVYRRLMCCYSRLGQRNRAVQWYKTCRQVIRTELHTSPDRKTIDLYNRLVNGEEI